jgi:hypothetical protein
MKDISSGALIAVNSPVKACTVSVPQQKLDTIVEKCQKVLKGRGMVATDEIQRLAGHLSWVGGIAPQ